MANTYEILTKITYILCNFYLILIKHIFILNKVTYIIYKISALAGEFKKVLYFGIYFITNSMQHERQQARINLIMLSRLYKIFYFMKQVIQASIASSHRVGKCIFEPSKQSRIRKSSFWSHRRSTVQWETALSSKERSRRVNCPMIVQNKYKKIYL